MAGYMVGTQVFTKASYDKEVQLATEGQTVFNVVYNVNFLDVLVNGVELGGSDYTANDGVTVVFNKPLAQDDEVTFKTWGAFEATNNNKLGAGIFWENNQVLAQDYTVIPNKNAMSIGDITLAKDVVVTILGNSKWLIV